MGLTAKDAKAQVADRLRALIESGLPGGTRPVHTALLLLNVTTGQEEIRLYSQAPDGEPGHEIGVFRSTAPHGAFALDLIAALHAHRLHHWRPNRDGYMPGVLNHATRRVTGQVGWAIDLRHLLEEASR
ncbi:hypothetical protein AB0J01_41260 [Streptomyces sp. NPDC050204]|uniref:hypothetical protein n=1 Tax=Streptomyces sp. NPDC050204 TaxID=3155514 RepID=UPI0034311DEE